MNSITQEIDKNFDDWEWGNHYAELEAGINRICRKTASDIIKAIIKTHNLGFSNGEKIFFSCKMVDQYPNREAANNGIVEKIVDGEDIIITWDFFTVFSEECRSMYSYNSEEAIDMIDGFIRALQTLKNELNE